MSRLRRKKCLIQNIPTQSRHLSPLVLPTRNANIHHHVCLLGITAQPIAVIARKMCIGRACGTGGILLAGG